MFLKMSTNNNNRLCLAAVAVFLIATTLVVDTDAATYTVGGNLGWRIPADAAAYATWASQNTYAVGDVLVFNFPTGQHDVAPVAKTAYDACNASAAIALLTVGPASVTLNFAGQHYFICTFGQHCIAGQKLAVNVTASSSSPLPSPPSTPQIPPSPSSLPLPPSSPAAPPRSPLPRTPSPSMIPPAQGPSPSGSASPPSQGPSPSSSASPPSEGPSPSGSASSPSEGPSPSDSASPPSPPSPTTPSPDGSAAPGSLPGGDGSVPSPPSPSGASEKGVAATISVVMFIAAVVGFVF